MGDLEQRIVAIVAGYAFALVGGFLYLTKIVDLIWSFDVNRAPAHPQIARLVGLVERALYVTAILMGHPEFVALWLVLKIAMDWKLERHWGEAPHLAYGAIFVGSGTSLLYAVIGVVIIRLGIANEWLVATGLAVLLLLASEGLRQLLLYQRRPPHQAKSDVVATEAPREEMTESAPAAAEPEARLANGSEFRGAEEPSLPEVTIPAAPPTRTRRSSEAIERQAEEIRAVIRADPGRGIAEIAAALGTGTAELRRPVQLLLESRMLRKQGDGRQTQYFPGLSRRKKVARVATSSRKKKAARKKKRR